MLVVLSLLLELYIVSVCQAQRVPLSSPHSLEVFSTSDKGTFLDLNRDGSPDFVNTAFLFGSSFVTLDETGRKLGTGLDQTVPPSLGSGYPTLASPLIYTAGKIDSDFRDDLVVLTADGILHYLQNVGSTQVDKILFQPSIVVDNLSTVYPTPSLVNLNSYTNLEIVDFDRDGFNDIVLGGGQNNYWSGINISSFVAFYKGDGSGNFVKFSYPFPNAAVVDAEVADIDGDGSIETIVVLTETTGSSVFTYDIVQLQFTGSRILASTSATRIPGKATSLEIIDVSGSAFKDYVVSVNSQNGISLSSQVYFFEGDGLGTVGPAWGNFSLPTNQLGIGDHIESMKTVDLDGDGNDDLLVLRGYTEPPPNTGGARPQYSNADLFVFMGPNLGSAQAQTFSLPGHYFPNFLTQTTGHYFRQCSSPMPNLIQVVDFASNMRPDIVVQGLQIILGTGNSARSYGRAAILMNTLPTEQGVAGFEKVGYPTGGVLEYNARIGFDGGRPTLSNPNFALNLQNVRGGSVVAPMWGSIASPGLIPLPQMGIELHTTPEIFGQPGVASGSLPGEGFHTVSLPIPNIPSLVGHFGYFQYNYVDPVTGQIGSSQATGVSIGN